MEIRKNIIQKSVAFNGRTLQTIVAMEELAELIQALSKELRSKHDKEHLVEEIADCYIVIETVKEMFNVSESEVQQLIIEKQNRQEQRNFKLENIGKR